MSACMSMLSNFRNHWFDIGFALSIVLGIALFYGSPDGMSLVMWLSLLSLLLHQTEEWRLPGYFPTFVNVVMFKSNLPDRYPLNANSGMIINVVLGWGSYLLAALFWNKAFWLAIATMIVSIGNILFHSLVLNIKGKTFYNPGLVTCWLCFAPVVCGFFYLTGADFFVSRSDWFLGVLIGFALNYFGVYKMILWLANPQTNFVFPRNYFPANFKASIEKMM